MQVYVIISYNNYSATTSLSPSLFIISTARSLSLNKMTRIISIFISIIVIECCCIFPTSTNNNVVIAFQLSLSVAAGNNVARPSFYRNTNKLGDSCTVIERTNTILSYSQTTDVDPSLRTSFEDRMRRIALTEQRKSSSSHDSQTSTTDIVPNRIKPDHIIDVTSISNFYDIVMGKDDGKPQNKISVVRWYATWCRSCRAVEPYFYGLQSKLGNVNNIQYIDVAATKDGMLHAGFNIPKVPYGHIYHPTFGLVEELRLTTKRIKDFELILRSYIDGYCDLSDTIYQETGMYGAQYQRST